MRRINSKVALTVLLTFTTIVIVILLILDLTLKVNQGERMTIILLLGIALLISLFLYGVIMFLIYKTKLQNTNLLVNSINSIEDTKEEIFGIGIIAYNNEQIISYISPWMQKEGFDKFLGKNISKLKINLETKKEQKIEYASRFWKVIVSRKNNVILFKDITTNVALRETIKLQQNAVLSVHTSFSKKLNFNEIIKSEALLKITQVNTEWANKVDGIYNSTISKENTSITIFRWEKGKADFENEFFLSTIKEALGKLSNDVTISIGLSFGIKELNELFEISLRSLETAKNRGGDQIIIEQHNGEILTLGSSSLQKTSNSSMNVRKFYFELIEDVNKAKEIFITSHKMADLDALGSVLGMYELLKPVNKEIKIILPEHDSTTSTLFKTLGNSIKENFINENDAMKIAGNRSHFIILDTSNPSLTQASKLLSQTSVERISVVDHHRYSQNEFDLIEDKLLIETSLSSASEIVVDMFRIMQNKESISVIPKEISTALLAGIQVDSKQLTKNITNSTFDAVSFLINNDADIKKINELFKPKQSLIKVEVEALKNISKPIKNVIFTFIPENMVVTEEFTSIIADKLLEYEGIEASFVLAKTTNNKYKVSARSNSNINVQLICEEIGGGGHFNIAAASWATNIKFNTIKKRILLAITKGIK